MFAGFVAKSDAMNWRRDWTRPASGAANLFPGGLTHYGKTCRHLRGLTCLPGATFLLNKMDDLIENHRDQDHRAHHDEVPVVIGTPDSADAVGIGVADLENREAVLDQF